MRRPWTTAAVLAPLLLAGYLVVLDFVDLFPWNDLAVVTARERALGLLVNELPLLLIAAAFLQPRRAPRLLAVLASALFFLGHLAAWWRPYLFGTSAEAAREHARVYGRTVTFLPPIGDHPTPNAAHAVVGVLALATLICTAMAAGAARQQRAARTRAPPDWSHLPGTTPRR